MVRVKGNEDVVHQRFPASDRRGARRRIKRKVYQKMKTTKFKPSEVGPIPVDWEVKRLGEIGDVVTGSTPPRDDMECWGGNYNWISAKDFKDKYIVDSEEKVTTKGMAFCRLLPSDSVLVTCIASIGLNAIAKNPCATNQQINAVICKACNNEYLYYQIEAAKDRMIELAGQTAVPIINKGDFENLMIPLPPRPEQEKIAEALSDVDALLAAMTKLIEKKRAIKQGAMQQLLTGKKRLAGFTGKWVEKRFDDCFEHIAAKEYQIQSTDYLNGGHYEVVDQGQNDVVGYTNDKAHLFKVPHGGVIIFGDHTRIVKYRQKDFVVGADGTQLLVGKEANTRFLSMVLQCKDIPNLGYARHFKFVKEGRYHLPSTLAEQQAIAAVLSDMDAEIAALEAKRAKYESIKQGIMQELLTGKTRLA